ncbi:hypothetical protein HanPI659440_Chr03g0101261 [Helianthus annuus]|nr:hypothetical protein HanPI659440_Chr03g0101261 [Helianthus annuus]
MMLENGTLFLVEEVVDPNNTSRKFLEHLIGGESALLRGGFWLIWRITGRM